MLLVCNNNLRKLWDGIKELVNIKPKNNASINCILVNGKTITAPMEIANNFNIYFTKLLITYYLMRMVINTILFI